MDALSPFTRRIVALGVLVLVLVTVANLLILPLFATLRSNLGRLGDVRFERAQTEAMADRPPPPPASPLRPGLFVVAASPAEATLRLTDAVRAKASAARVVVGTIAPAGAAGRPGVVAVDISVAGSERDVLAFLNGVEGDRLLMRLVRWRLQVDDKHRVQLDGRVTAAWGQA